MIPQYSLAEERLNVRSHIAGLLLSIVALVALLIKAAAIGDGLYLISFGIFGVSLIVLYGTSSVYHSCKEIERRTRLRIADHASIYVLIAGTYTPFTLITLQGTTGWVIFGVCWGMALIGIVLKLFFTGRFNLVSTLMYVFMGWLIVFAIRPLIDNFSGGGMNWLVAGGLSYTFGAVLYSIKRIPFNHALFHFFVLLGSICHFMAIYFYV